MRRIPVLWFCLALLAVSCAGDSGDAANDLAPWGLDKIDMPDTDEEVVAAISALPDEIDGRSRSGGGISGGSAAVMYGDEPVFSIVQVQPTEQLEMLGRPGATTPTDWVKEFGSGKNVGLIIEERALTGDLLWVAAHEDGPTLPGEMGTAYVLQWAEAGGDFLFYIEAGSEQGRAALVQAFITAAGG